MMGAAHSQLRDGDFDWGTALQAGKLRVRFLMGLLEFHDHKTDGETVYRRIL